MKKTIERASSVLKGVSTLDTMMKRSRIILLLVLSMTALGGAVRGGHSTLDLVDPSFNPQVQTNRLHCKWVDQIIPLPDGKILVAGLFNSYNHQPVGRLVRLNADGTLDTTFNSNLQFSGAFIEMVVQADGKILVILETHIQKDELINQLIRLNADGTTDVTFNVLQPAGAYLESMAIDANGRIIVSGAFPENNGYLSVIRLNPDGSRDTTFQSTLNVDTRGVAIQNNKIIISSFGELLRLNENGTIDSSFSTRNFSTRSMFVQPDGKILTLNDLPQGLSEVRRLNENGSDDTGFTITTSPIPSQQPWVMALSNDGKITRAIPTGNFGQYQIRRFLPNGTEDSSFTPYAAARLTSLAVQADGGVLIGDGGGSCSAPLMNDFVRLLPNGSPDPTFNTGTGFQTLDPGIVRTINVQPDDKILIGGRFDFVNNVSQPNIARLNADSTLDPSFQINTSGTGNYFLWIGDFSTIRSQSDGKIVATGGFRYVVNGVTKSNLVRLNSDGSIDPTFILGVSIVALGPNRLATYNDGKLLVGTSRTGLNEDAVPVKLTTTGERDTSFIPGVYRQYYEVIIFDVAVQPDGKIIIGGRYTTETGMGITKSFLTRLNADGSLDTTFQTREQLHKEVSAFILLPNGKIVIAETALTSAITFQSSVLRLNSDGSLDLTFNAGAGANGKINTLLLLSTGRVFVGGRFTTFNGQPRANLVQINADGSVFTPIYNLNNEVLSLAVDADGRVFVGGSFTTVIAGNSSAPRSYVAALIDASITPFDFDGDGKTDVGIFRPADGSWWYLSSVDNAFHVSRFGTASDKIVPGDFTGDGKADIAVFRASTGEWFIQRSEDHSFFSFPFGASGDIPAPMDYDADGKTDAAVFRPSSGTWFILNSSGGTSIVQFGSAEDKPVPADFDGDGKADIAIFRPSDGSWWYLRSSDSQFRVFRFGVGTDKPVQGDYSGDGKADLAVFRPSTGEWFVQRSEDGSYFSLPFGAMGDLAVPGDYDGDGKFDTAVFRPSNSTWYLNQTSAGVGIVTFGSTGDLPVPNAFVP